MASKPDVDLVVHILGRAADRNRIEVEFHDVGKETAKMRVMDGDRTGDFTVTPREKNILNYITDVLTLGAAYSIGNVELSAPNGKTRSFLLDADHLDDCLIVAHGLGPVRALDWAVRRIKSPAPNV